MLKLAGVLLVLMIVFGVLGFVVHVAGWIAKVLFVACLIGFVVSLVVKGVRRA